MEHIITIETAEYSKADGFEYRIADRFPLTVRGFALAVMAAERMASLDGYVSHHADIRLTVPGVELTDAMFFNLLAFAANRPDTLVRECEAMMATSTIPTGAVSAEEKLARIAVAAKQAEAGRSNWDLEKGLKSILETLAA
ncbi:hypothetical protein FY136_28550 (plasmid) [Agrobacterium tumefaciens]|uniref:hypothetical protein n=1 Tax=Agrobacterium tumefaciens TaxID=358 RepID=UPI0021CE5D09|nr:hypothetical protein [Agrobacterium tumefaciens]UXT53214.1 hypothetical protein FY136_28550 [Agrobacterium tumefaciens]